MGNMLLVFVLLLTGILLRRLAALHLRDRAIGSWLFSVPANLADGLTGFVIYVSLPALILLRIPSLEISENLLVPVLLPWAMLVISAMLVLMVCHIFGWTGNMKALLLLLVPLGNTSFLGIPMVEAFFGEEYIRYALLYDQLGSFLALATYGALITSLFAGRSGETKRPGRSSQVLMKIAAFPPFIALVIAFSLRSVTYPQPVLHMLDVLSSTLIPLVMVAVGFKMELRIDPRRRTALAAGLFLKLIAAPLLALAGIRLLGLNDPVTHVAVFEAGMPSMVAAWAVAMKAGFEPELGASMVGLGILLSFVTLSGLFQLL